MKTWGSQGSTRVNPCRRPRERRAPKTQPDEEAQEHLNHTLPKDQAQNTSRLRPPRAMRIPTS